MISHQYCVHTGSSMHPTLRESDLLEIIPYGDQAVQAGDVILFPSPKDEQLVVHRVIRVTPQGICTRGDNNSAPDPYLLQSADVIGRVMSVWSGQKRREIMGGRGGLVLAHSIHWLSALKRRLSFLLRPLYHHLARQGLVRRLLPKQFKPRVVIFQAGDSRSVQLLLGKRTVGRYNFQQQRWHIQRPFQILIDEQKLSLEEMML